MQANMLPVYCGPRAIIHRGFSSVRIHVLLLTNTPSPVYISVSVPLYSEAIVFFNHTLISVVY